jgi:rhodanese-related sulfurtransferase
MVLARPILPAIEIGVSLRFAVATLRKAGFDARYTAGGHFAWKAIKGPVKLFG